MLARRSLLAAAAALVAAPARARPDGRLHALLVGINDYRDPRNQLRGCVNDAKLLAGRLRALGANVATLLDAQATRANVLAAWDATTRAAAAGDTLILHFAGHGSPAPRMAGGAGLQKDGTFILFRDYEPTRAPGEMLLDAELFALLTPLPKRGVQPVVLLDCCYAGGLTRGIDPRAAGADRFRYADLDMNAVANGMADLPPPPAPPPPAELAPILFLAACQANETDPEIRLPDGTWHGALSYGFCNAISGAAPTRTPGVLTRGELYNHILQSAQGLAEGRQHPVMRPSDQLDEPILRLPIPASPRAPSADSIRATDAPVRLAVLNGAAGDARAVAGAVPAPSDKDWDLLWDARDEAAFGPGRDRFADRTPREALPALVQRVRAQRRLIELAGASGLTFRLRWPGAAEQDAANDAAYPRGRKLYFQADNLRLPYLLMFDLTGQGTVQYVYPGSGARQQRLAAGEAPRPGGCVRDPFGSDLAVAVASDRPLPDLVAALEAAQDRAAIPQVMSTLEAALAAGVDWQIGLHTLVTKERTAETRECGP